MKMYVCEVQTIREINCRTYNSFNGRLSPNWQTFKPISKNFGPYTLYGIGQQATISLVGWYDIKVDAISSASVGGYDSIGGATCSYKIEKEKVVITLTSIDEDMARALCWITISGYTINE